MKRILWGILAIIILTALIQENIVKSSSSSDVSHQPHGMTGIVPVPISQIEGTPQGPVAASNGYTLEIVATVDIPFPQDMVIEGNHAYLIGSNTWFQVLDISDPYQPESIAVENLLESMTRKIVVNNGYAYVIEANTKSFPFKWFLTVIDISSPDTPQLVDRYEAPTYNNMTIAGQYLYLASYWDEPGMFIYNIANPEHPILFSSHPAQGGSIAVDVERELIAMTAGEIGLILFRQVTVESQIWLPFININASI